MKTIFEKSIAGKRGVFVENDVDDRPQIDDSLLRREPAGLPECSEGQVVRHYTNLSRLNFCVDTHPYPLGSCTMKYNPRACERAAALPELAGIHPLWAQLPGGERLAQGSLRVIFETERLLAEVTGMSAYTLQPMAGSHGELTGALIMAAYHRERGNRKTHIIIPDSAHGTNPASARLAGFDVVTVPSDKLGVMDFEAFKQALNDETAGVMLTCPNTLGLFNPHVRDIADEVHGVDGLMYYDGANLNALLGRCKPGHMGFDLCHLNLHKTFGTPHGAGGPGSGPVGVAEKLKPYLPVPRIIRGSNDLLRLNFDEPGSIGSVAPFYGNFGVVVRAYAYLLLLGRDGLREVGEMCVLQANYLQERLRGHLQAVTDGRCMHECVFSGEPLTAHGVNTLDLAKGLIDRGFHPPTVYFPLNVPEAMMFEPTETESRESIDELADAIIELVELARSNPAALQQAPSAMPVGRLDEVRAARKPDVVQSDA